MAETTQLFSSKSEPHNPSLNANVESLPDALKCNQNQRLERKLCVKEIVDVSFSKEGSRRYKIKWEDSWEREDVLLKSCKELLRDFWIYHVELEPAPKSSNTTSDTTVHDIFDHTYTNNCNTLNENADNYTVSPPAVTVPAIQIPEQPRPPIKINDLPTEYKNVGFAKSVREMFSANNSSGNGTNDNTLENTNLNSTINPTVATKSFIENKQTFVEYNNDNFDFVAEVIQKTKQVKSKKTYRRKDGIEKDFVSFQKDQRVTCEICGETFFDKKMLKGHKITRHNEYSPHQCTVCGKMFNKPGDVRRHMAVHSCDRKFACLYCAYTYKTQNHLQRHVKAHHSGESITLRNNILHNKNNNVAQNPLSKQPFLFPRNDKFHIMLLKQEATPKANSVDITKKTFIEAARQLNEKEQTTLKLPKTQQIPLSTGQILLNSDQTLNLKIFDNASKK